MISYPCEVEDPLPVTCSCALSMTVMKIHLGREPISTIDQLGELTAIVSRMRCISQVPRDLEDRDEEWSAVIHGIANFIPMKRFSTISTRQHRVHTDLVQVLVPVYAF